MKYHRHLLQSCTEALGAIFFEGRYADKCIEYYLRNNKKWGGRDRRFFAETVYDCVRWWGRDWAIIGEKPTRPDLAFLSVSLWRRGMPLPPFSEFENVSYDSFEKNEAQISEPHIQQAFPRWLYKKIALEVGDLWQEISPYFNDPNQLVIRANTQKISRDQLIKKLGELEIIGKVLVGTDAGIIIDKRTNIFRTELFRKGFFEVQDGASQQVALYLDIEPGLRVIDACAGAGGKTLHISDLMQNKGKIISLDVHQWKLDQLKLRARRNSYSNIEMKAIEGSKTIKRLKGTADRLLLDVPCTGLGVLRRNPDTKWKISEISINEVIELQKNLLRDYCVMVKGGGLLLYSTCSILPSENQDQVAKFLENNSEFSLLKQRYLYPTRPGYDGFYMALMKKRN